MKQKHWFVALAICCAPFLISTPVHADTDGTELQVSEPAQLDIQLGPSWKGVEFQLKTDVGLYPNTIIVDDNGVLHTELGGSNHYILTCLNSSTALPNPEQQPSSSSSTQTSEVSKSESDLTEQGNKTSMSAVIFFFCGIMIAIGIFLYLQISMKKERKQSSSEDDEEE